MESLIHAFGLDARLIVIQMINFTALAVLLSYFLYKPIMRIVNEREEKISEGIKNAEAASKALEEAEDKKGEILSIANREAEAVVTRAKESAKVEAAEIVGEAEKTAADRVRQGEERGQVLAEEARRKSEAEVARLAVLAAAEILQKEAK